MKLGPILPDSHDVNVSFTSFYSKMSNIVDKYVALKKLQKKEIKFTSVWTMDYPCHQGIYGHKE